MNRYYPLLSVILFFNSCLIYADEQNIADLKSLQQQVFDLQKRVTELENQTTNPIDSVNNKKIVESAWQQLKIGMNYQEVTRLLGKPEYKTRGSVEFWYYSEQKSDGPFAKFIFKRLNNWQEHP
ncbi:hypothetical protein MNBD_GAMMA16-757 [hydrothermal vent metagenome]|uniref:Outer membrane protein assembly factor BamE domain-containing protein n=1 Tax=hydrothermal vent metagenome TaxID=652676 RepID=A0A3B0ZU20_9ZZZZ